MKGWQKAWEEYAKAIASYLALLVDKIASSSNTLSRWQSNGEKIADVFSRQALPMVWDYAEVNILTGASRSYTELFSDIIRIIHERILYFNSLCHHPILCHLSSLS